jgi:hypothetical protein
MFTIVPVDIQVGETAIGVCPVKLVKGFPFTEMIAGEVTKIETDPVYMDRMVTVKATLPDKTIHERELGEHRVAEFTFGGVMVKNPKFDRKRVEKEDKDFLKKYGLGS